MRVRIIAVGQRPVAWVRAGFDDYAGRLKGPLRFELLELPYGRRSKSGSARAVAEESERLLAALQPDDHVVALDEHGQQFSTRQCADWLALRQRCGENLALLIGGPDGLGPEVLARANQRWSLSRLTFPHALVRLLLAEQLYRAYSVLANHPYHRE